MANSSQHPRRPLDEVEAYVDQIREDVAMGEIPDLAPGRADHSWWLAARERGITRILAFQYISRPRRRLLIDFYASPLDVEALATLGLTRNAGSVSLFSYQFDFLAKSPHEVLPEEILLAETDNGAALERLRLEVNAVKDTVWSDLWMSCLQERPDWQPSQA